MAVRLPIPAPPSQEEFHWLLQPPEDLPPEQLKWYIDGSLIDPSTPFHRVGAGMVGIAGGVPRAVAWAIPPPWIDTIPGAEAWALYVVLSICVRLPQVTTDCMGNRRTILEGREAATAASRPLARVWNAIFSCCEGALMSELDAMLTWGPAHTTWASLGTRLKSDGNPLTAIDWRANAIADAVAKIAAKRTRAPAQIRVKYQQLMAAHRYGAAVAGVACYEANHHETRVTDTNGNVTWTTRRDSIGRQEVYCSQSHEALQNPFKLPVPAAAATARDDEDSLLDSALPPDFPRHVGSIPLHQAAQLLCPGATCPTARPTSRAPTSSGNAHQRTTSARRPGPGAAGRARAAKVFGENRQEAVQAAALANQLLHAHGRTAPLTPEETRSRVHSLIQAAAAPPLSEPDAVHEQLVGEPKSKYNCTLISAPEVAHSALIGSENLPAAKAQPRSHARSGSKRRSTPSSSGNGMVTGAMWRLMHGSSLPS